MAVQSRDDSIARICEVINLANAISISKSTGHYINEIIVPIMYILLTFINCMKYNYTMCHSVQTVFIFCMKVSSAGKFL